MTKTMKKVIAITLCISLINSLLPESIISTMLKPMIKQVNADNLTADVADYIMLYDSGTKTYEDSSAVGLNVGDYITFDSGSPYVWSIDGSGPGLNPASVVRYTTTPTGSLAAETSTPTFYASESGVVNIILKNSSDNSIYGKIIVAVGDTLALNSYYFELSSGSSPASIQAITSTKEGTFTWSISDPAVATITPNAKDPSSATITPIYKGPNNSANATITLVHKNNAVTRTISASIFVTVPVVSVTINGELNGSHAMTAGQQISLTALITPSNVYNEEVKWISTNPDVASVTYINLNAIVTAESEGTASIAVVSEDNTILATYNITVRVPVVQVVLNEKFYNITIKKGSILNLFPIIEPNDATRPQFRITSSDPSIVEVISGDAIRALKEGTALVTVIPVGYGHYEPAQCTITVGIPVESIDNDPESVQIYTNNTAYIFPNIFPVTATNKEVTWKSSNTNVATVIKTGNNAVVVGNSAGTATITSTTVDGMLQSKTKVIVKEHVNKITLSNTSTNIPVGKSKTLSATALPSTASNKTVKWSSSNTKVATVSSSGKITAKSLGTATITCSSTDGSQVKSICKIRVITPINSILLVYDSVTGVLGNTYSLNAKVYPSSATIKGLKWSSHDTSVATVSSSGKVTIQGVGVAKITATSTDGSGKTATCYVYGIEPIYAQTLNVNTSKVLLFPNNTYKIKSSLTPSTSTEYIYYSSNKSSVASVSNTGVITAKNPGIAVITVRTSDTDMAHTILINVLKINKKTLTLNKGSKYTLAIGGSTTKVTWKSSNTNIATVKSNGTYSCSVTAKKSGTVTITATVGSKKLTCKVTVR